MRSLWFSVVLLVLPVLAFTPAETNQVVKSMLNRIMADAYDDNWTHEPKIILPQQRIDTWETFIGGTIAPGWSFNDKKGAFDWYLSTLGTKECLDLPKGQKDYVIGAISQCYDLRYTNAIPYLRRLAFNTKGVHRDSAIETVIQLGRVNEEMNCFVESVITNCAIFSLRERESAFAEYADKLIAMTNECLSAERLNAGRMFYRNRFVGTVGEISTDWAVKACFPLYETSSNRLQTAMWILAQEDCAPHVRDYFISVTNQLLTSGRPLVLLTIGEGE